MSQWSSLRIALHYGHADVNMQSSILCQLLRGETIRGSFNAVAWEIFVAIPAVTGDLFVGPDKPYQCRSLPLGIQI
jgi:hypothetical protein